MESYQPVHRFINLLDPSSNVLLNVSFDEAAEAVSSGDANRVDAIEGQFAIAQRCGKTIRMARSIGRPMRYFLAKQAAGPLLVVAERMDELYRVLDQEGLAGQFHPSYTRMIPAHHLTELTLIGCPDPNPVHKRFFNPQRDRLPADIEEIGRRYVGALATACSRWLDGLSSDAPLGVLFSGGIDSGALLILMNHLLLARGESPARLKAFTLAIDNDASDHHQAIKFVQTAGLEMLLEIVEVPATDLDYRAAIRVVEDYKPLDIQSATMGLALCREIRRRYSEWKYLVDGDGGDENLKDYPIEDNPELTIRSVLNNQMLYQEGWGVHAIKHSLVHSGGQSRGHVRTSAPASLLGFEGFSPYALPGVIRVAEGIPFVRLTEWSHEKLYALKGEVVRAGIEQVTGVQMPIFPKCRFQDGAISGDRGAKLFPASEQEYRQSFQDIFADPEILRRQALEACH